MKSKLINKLKTLGFAGFLALNGCISAPQQLSFEEQYGRQLGIEINDIYLFLKYDRDFDGFEDLRLIYEMGGVNGRTFYLELIQRWDDVNRNRVFEDEEITILTESKDQPILEKDNPIFENLIKY